MKKLDLQMMASIEGGKINWISFASGACIGVGLALTLTGVGASIGTPLAIGCGVYDLLT